MILMCMGRLQDAWAKKMDMAEQTASVRTTQLQRAQLFVRAFFFPFRHGSSNQGHGILYFGSL